LIKERKRRNPGKKEAKSREMLSPSYRVTEEEKIEKRKQGERKKGKKDRNCNINAASFAGPGRILKAPA